MTYLTNPWQHELHAQCSECSGRFNVSYIKGNKKPMMRVKHYCPYCGATTVAYVVKYLEEPFDPRERDKET